MYGSLVATHRAGITDGNMSDDAKRPERISLGRYYNAAQLRADSWNRLKVLAQRRAEKRSAGVDTAGLHHEFAQALDTLEPIESYWAFPSKQAFEHIRMLFEQGDDSRLARLVARIVRALVSQSYRRGMISMDFYHDAEDEENDDAILESFAEADAAPDRPYFEVLVVDNISAHDERTLRSGLRAMRRPEDSFVYDVVVVPSFEDALIAVLFNHNLQAAVIRYGFPFASRHNLDVLHRYLEAVDERALEGRPDADHGPLLGRVIGELRPELDCYLVTDSAVEDVAGEIAQHFQRIFYRQEDYLELHLSILRGIEHRYETPFFTALREYAKQPTGVFHAMPISRGKSVTKSHWIQDMARFYGMNMFLAETSATSGGLDSLLQPLGPIKKAQQLAARAFGARHTFFVTNGTSTANKVVMQALVTPGDIVLVDRDCHKSLHYGMVLGGGYVDYLDAYPLHDYSMYGAVPLRQIKARLLAYKRAGKLDRVKLLVLTNCTFDGLIYNVERVIGGVPGNQAQPGVPLGRGVVRLRQFRARLPPAHRHVRRQQAAPALCRRTLPRRIRGLARRLRQARWRRRRDLARHAADARPRCGAGACLCHPFDAQDADLAAPGLDDSRQRPGLPRQGRGGLPRGLYDTHLDLAELPDTRLARHRPASGRARGLRAGAEAESSWPWCCANASRHTRCCRNISIS